MTTLRYFDDLQYGSIKGLSVLVDPSDNSLWVTQPTAQKLLGWEDLDPTGLRAKLKSKAFQRFIGGCKENALESSKALTDKGFAGVKTIQGLDSLGRPNKFKAIPLKSFVALLYWQLQERNPKAEALLLAGFADSFSSLILDQCGIQVSTAERQSIVSEYLTEYHELYDWIRDRFLEYYGYPATHEHYRYVAKLFNRTLFGVDHFRCDRLNNASSRQLRQLENYQRVVFDHVKDYRDIDPLPAVTKVLRMITSIKL